MDDLIKRDDALKLCPSCREPLNYPSGDGCAAMRLHKEVMMTDLIRRDDALAACDIAPPDEWNDYTKGGYDFAAEECKRNIAALPAIDPAAIREAALTAKLAKALRDTTHMLSQCQFTDMRHKVVNEARAVLAELERKE